MLLNKKHVTEMKMAFNGFFVGPDIAEERIG